MPITNINSSQEKGPGGGGRTTFRPPWVKDTNTPTTPWSKRNSTAGAASADTSKENGAAAPEKKEVKLQSKEIKVPVTTITAKKTTPIAAKSAKEPTKEPATKKEEDKKTIGRTIPIEVKKESPAACAEKPGKFVRPLLKKVAKIDAVPAAPVVLEKAILKETPKVAVPVSATKTQPIVSKLKPTQKEESEEEETSSEEEETEEEEEETDEEEETEEEESEEEASTTVSSASKGKSCIYMYNEDIPNRLFCCPI